MYIVLVFHKLMIKADSRCINCYGFTGLLKVILSTKDKIDAQMTSLDHST